MSQLQNSPVYPGRVESCGGEMTMIFVLFQVWGSHRRQTEEEWQRLVGEEVFRRVTVEDSAGDDFAEVAVSRRGTPFEVYGPVLRADLRICIGNNDYHYLQDIAVAPKPWFHGCVLAAPSRSKSCYDAGRGAKSAVLKGIRFVLTWRRS